MTEVDPPVQVLGAAGDRNSMGPTSPSSPQAPLAKHSFSMPRYPSRVGAPRWCQPCLDALEHAPPLFGKHQMVDAVAVDDQVEPGSSVRYARHTHHLIPYRQTASGRDYLSQPELPPAPRQRPTQPMASPARGILERVFQASRRGGFVACEWEGDRVKLRGRAVAVLEGRLLPEAEPKRGAPPPHLKSLLDEGAVGR